MEWGLRNKLGLWGMYQYFYRVYRQWTGRIVNEDFSIVTSPSVHAGSVSQAITGICRISKSPDLLPAGRSIAHRHAMAAPDATPTLEPPCRVLIYEYIFAAHPSVIRLPCRHLPGHSAIGHITKLLSSLGESNFAKDCIHA